MDNFEHLYNTHGDGKSTVVILGNGPSLKDVPRSYLACYPTFGTNKIYLLDGFQPTYYACVNPLVASQNANEIADRLTASTKFVTDQLEWHVTPPHTYYLHSHGVKMFSYNPSRYVYEGHTVTFVALQIAFFLGFRTALLLGVDHRYVFNGAPNEVSMDTGDDVNHFDPDYFRGQPWHNPDLAASEEAYAMALKAYEDDGRQIYNLTPNSALDVFQKEDVRSWLW